MAGKLSSGKRSSVMYLAFVVLFLVLPFLLKIRVAEASPNNNGTLILSGNTTILSPNRTFELGFFFFSTSTSTSTSTSSSFCYLAICYASLPIRTFAWIANRKQNQTLTGLTLTLTLTLAGQLSIVDSTTGSAIWTTQNRLPATHLRLLDTGNLLLLTPTGRIAWQSFDFPTDTWLPEMPITGDKPLISWKSPSDPSPGLYSLRLQPDNFGEFELVFNGSLRYWSTGNWTGTRFTAVPEMTVPYIYTFRFSDPFTPAASFVYSQTPLPTGPDSDGPVLTRFVIDSSGRLLQYVWSSQAATWNAFWSRPESGCSVYGRCGNLGFCVDGIRQCRCVGGLVPADLDAWDSGDFSGGCASPCGSDDRFEDIGGVNFQGAVFLSIAAGGVGQSTCEDSCRSNCSCFGIRYDAETKLCRNYYGNVYNLQNSTESPVLYLRVATSTSGDVSRRREKKSTTSGLVVGSSVCSLLLIVIVVSVISIVFFWRRGRKEMDKEAQGAKYCNLRVFSYKELSAATHGFSEKLGQGGFGTVFRGELSDSTPVAVKRLERPGSGGGEREFRAEVRTIGAVHHVNLVRLRGFCCEDPHRLLVYEYMPGGSLSAYLDRARPSELSWQARFGIALGTARGIAYLHEECRDRIIHCDIKPDNILLDDGHIPKVADFGLAKLMGRDFSRVLATMRGTWGYVAPEWISGIAITTKADVYSYGMTLLEILGGRRNVEAAAAAAAVAEEAETTEEGWYFPPWAARRIIEGDVAAVVDPALAGEYDMGELERAAKVAVWCIQDEEIARPTMGTVLKMLEGTVEVAVPPLPKLLQALVSGESFPRAAGIVSVSDEEISSAALPDQSRN